MEDLSAQDGGCEELLNSIAQWTVLIIMLSNHPLNICPFTRQTESGHSMLREDMLSLHWRDSAHCPPTQITSEELSPHFPSPHYVESIGVDRQSSSCKFR